MYGKLVTSKTNEVLITVKQIGDRIAVIVGDDAKVICFITKKMYDEPELIIPEGIKFTQEKQSTVSSETI